jgi:hypothetical protein
MGGGMGTAMTCLWCTADVTNGLALCERCQRTLSVSLVNVAAYFTDVDKIRPGQRVKVRSAYQSAPPPAIEPAPDRIGEALDTAATIVYGWARNLEDDRPGSLKELPPSTVARCGWLEAYVATIATLEWAAECLREIRDCERDLKRILDRADTGKYVGVCGNEIGREEYDGETFPITCERHLYLPPTMVYVTCPECGRSWDGEQRQAMMLKHAREELAPIRVIAKVVVHLSEDEPSEERLTRRIEKWVERGRLTDYGVRVLEGRPRRVYRIDDVLRLVAPTLPAEGEAC